MEESKKLLCAAQAKKKKEEMKKRKAQMWGTRHGESRKGARALKYPSRGGGDDGGRIGFSGVCSMVRKMEITASDPSFDPPRNTQIRHLRRPSTLTML